MVPLEVSAVDTSEDELPSVWVVGVAVEPEGEDLLLQEVLLDHCLPARSQGRSPVSFLTLPLSLSLRKMAGAGGGISRMLMSSPDGRDPSDGDLLEAQPENAVELGQKKYEIRLALCLHESLRNADLVRRW